MPEMECSIEVRGSVQVGCGCAVVRCAQLTRSACAGFGEVLECPDAPDRRAQHPCCYHGNQPKVSGEQYRFRAVGSD